MGVLKKLTDEYFGNTIREEEKIDISGLDVEIISFKDKNGKLHSHGYRVKGPDVITDETQFNFKENLKELILRIIKKKGNECSLNDVDVSNIFDFSDLFLKSDFDGDISGWDVSSAMVMDGMFACSKFTGKNGIFKLENGNSLTSAYQMFLNSSFDTDISGWDVSGVVSMGQMFENSNFSHDVSGWVVKKGCLIKDMFKSSPAENNPPKWYDDTTWFFDGL